MILVTGSSGTIGTALMKRLIDEGYDVIGLDKRDNRWIPEVEERAVVGNVEDVDSDFPVEPGLIVHLAANARVHRLVQHPDRAKENFDTTFEILEYARRIGSDLIFGSSREVYGNSGKLIYSETDTYVDECESPYTASKVGGEALVNSYQNCYDIDTCILRFSNVYGKYDASDRVVPKFIAQTSRDEDLVVYGQDKVLDFTYIDDCVNGIMSVIENYDKASGTTFNIASGQGASLTEVARKISFENEVVVEANRTGEVSRYVADIEKAQKVLGYQPEYSIDDGIDAAREWYRERDYLYEEILE